MNLLAWLALFHWMDTIITFLLVCGPYRIIITTVITGNLVVKIFMFMSNYFCLWRESMKVFKPGMCWPHTCACLVSWNCFGLHVDMCVFVCPLPRPLITSSMIWCDIDHVWLVKQVLWFFCFLVALYGTCHW